MKMFSPLSSRLPRLAVGPQRRDLQFSQPASDSDRSATLPFVIPTEPRISYYAAPPTTTYAAFIEESRMKFADPTKLDRKSGGSGGICGSLNQHLIQTEAPPSPLSSRPKWRDLQFSQPASDSNRGAALPFVIPTAAEGSALAVICSSAGISQSSRDPIDGCGDGPIDGV
jgi:hypothetical protein